MTDESSTEAAPHPSLTILYEDDWMVAVDKPAGLLVHRTKLDARETRFAMQLVRDQVGYRVWPLHRLDKPTSGVLLFARSADQARILSDLFADRQAEKIYQAVVRGWTPDEDIIDYPLKEIRDRTTDSKARLDKPAQEAVSHYRTLARCEADYPVGRYDTARYSLVEVRPETGRKNQIRRHFKHIFHPVVGDRKFGDRAHNAFFRSSLGIERMLLAATDLRFLHPETGNPVHIASPDPFPVRVNDLFESAT